jgi:hypothetical protein
VIEEVIEEQHEEVIDGVIERIGNYKQFGDMSQLSKIIAERMLYGKMAIK